MKNFIKQAFPHALAMLLFFPVSVVFAKDRFPVCKDSSSPGEIYMAYMDKMMDKMGKQSSTISPEIDFLQQMVAHHEGAIEMATYEISNGKNFEMIQLAKSILREQCSEVNMMKCWLNSSSLPKTGLPQNYEAAMNLSMSKMMDDMRADYSNTDTDHSFAQIMIPHHIAAIDMAKVMLKYSSDSAVIAYAKQLISNEAIEVEQMSSFIK